MDLGTGSGFPGVVIAALRPDIKVTLVESRTRRIEWLNGVRDALTLSNVNVVGSRLELVPSRAFDAISARAFAPLGPLLDLACRFSTSDTLWLLPKGRSAAQELGDLRGWHHTFHVEPSLTDIQAGIVVGKLAGRKG
jgi:16S rRNA (guanine527-N7)-methyltransferase